MNERYTQLSILFFAVLLPIAACDNGQETETEEEAVRLVAIETITMEPDSFEDFIRITGIVEAINDAVVSSESQGQVQSIADRGASLRRGDQIAGLDNRLISAQYDAAQTSFRLAQNTFERLKSLHADSIISTQDLDNAKAQLDQAEAQLDQAEKQLGDSTIEAPFNGIIEERFVTAGEYIGPGMPVARLVNTERVRILAGVPESYSGEITDGSEVEIRLRDMQNSSIRSRITYAGNVIDPDTRTYTVEIELSNPEKLVKPQMVVDLRVKRRQIDDALIIPRTAVLRSQGGENVFKAVESNGEKYAQLVEVSTGQASGALIEIISGLEPTDEIVITGISNLNDGDRLNILNNETSTERAEKLSAAERPFVSY